MVVTQSMLDQCRAGDRTAWQRVFEYWAPRIYRWAVLRGLRASDAEDAAQDVLVIAHRRIHQCHAPEAMDAWFYQITRRVVANARRRVWWRRVFPTDTPIEPAFEGPRDTLGVELSVRACLARLADPLAEVLMLSEVEGYTRDEIAEMIGVPAGTVASRLRRAREAFKDVWAAEATDATPLERV